MSNRNPRITLEEISQRKTEVLERIRVQHKVIAGVTEEMFSPLLPSSRQNKSSLITKFNTGMAIFEGVIVGIKFLYRIRKALQKRY